jgi:phospholipase A1
LKTLDFLNFGKNFMYCKRIITYLFAAILFCVPIVCSAAVEESRMVKPFGNMARWFGRGLSLHKTNYLLPTTWGNRATDSADAELKFQLSFKQQIASSGFYFAYTQKSFWRILDAADSRPFRETNHNPEIFYRFETGSLQWSNLGLDVGFEHESNGAREPTSRSWNRVYITPFVEFDRFSASLKLWHRLSEDVKRYPTDPTGDENPDIVDFLGHGELRLGYLLSNSQKIDLMGRYNFSAGKGALQCDYSIPFAEINTSLYFQIWTGYGESLIDYDRSLTRYGLGFRFGGF